jgi:hypothetical protein
MRPDDFVCLCFRSVQYSISEKVTVQRFEDFMGIRHGSLSQN